MSSILDIRPKPQAGNYILYRTDRSHFPVIVEKPVYYENLECAIQDADLYVKPTGRLGLVSRVTDLKGNSLYSTANHPCYSWRKGGRIE